MDSPVPVIPALADHLIAGSAKRLRPLLTVAAARLAGARDDACLKLAAAVEFIHTATLLHDDVVDSSQLRRGRVAAHLIWGAPSSVLVGDFLFARAFELMVEAGSMPALEILARASRVIAEGEVLQLTRAHDLDLSQEVYLEIIKAKTAELFAAAAEAGAVSAGASPERCRALRRLRPGPGPRLPAGRRRPGLFRRQPDAGQEPRRRLPRRQGDPAAAAGHRPHGRDRARVLDPHRRPARADRRRFPTAPAS